MKVHSNASPTAASPGDVRGPFNQRVTFDDIARRVKAIDLGDTPETMRERFAHLMLGEETERPPPVGEAHAWGGVDGLLIAPTKSTSEAAGCILWFHGGGYVFGAPETHGRPAAALASKTGVSVFLPRYRLAPEHPWPAQLDDALAVAHGMQDAGRRIALAGDSAGGHLALVAALALAREGRPTAALALFSPNTDRTGRSTTRAANTPYDPMNSDEDDAALAQMVFGDYPDDHPEVSPLLDDLSLLPPTHVEVGGREVLLDDARRLARRAQGLGAAATLHVEPGAFHMWQLWTPWLPAADASLGRAAAFLRLHPGLG